MKYYIDMLNYEKFGLDYLTAVENYILTEVFNQMEERDFLDIYVINWSIPLNIGIYKEKLHHYVPALIKRLNKVDELEHFLSHAASIQ
jgi:hypothetical protein